MRRKTPGCTRATPHRDRPATILASWASRPSLVSPASFKVVASNSNLGDASLCPMDNFNDATLLVGSSERWAALSDEDIVQVLIMAVGEYSAKSQPSEQALTTFYEFVQERLSTDARLGVVVTLNGFAERFGRDYGQCPLASAFRLFIHVDDDPQVISTAALNAAQLIHDAEGGPLAGPRALLAEAALVKEDTRRAAISEACCSSASLRSTLWSWTSGRRCRNPCNTPCCSPSAGYCQHLRA